MQDRIEKRIHLNAPVERVWRALTDHEEFGEWFRVKLDSPFVVGETTRGHVTVEGLEHIKLEVTVKAMEQNRLFSFSGHPNAIEPDVDYSNEPQTLVEFKLEPTENGTTLVISESGFSALPRDRRDLAFRENTKGWEVQAENIAAYVET